MAVVKTPDLHVETVTWNGITWVNIERPGREDTEYLTRNYPFHPFDLEDCVTRVQLPKIDEYADYLFIVLHFPAFNHESRAIMPSQVSMFLGKDYLVTLHPGELKPLVKLFRDCQLHQDAQEENMGRSPGYLLYRIVDRLVDYCFPILNKIIENIEAVEERIFSEDMRETVRELSILRRNIIAYRRINWPLRAVIGSLEHKVRRFSREDMGIYFGDVVDHLDTLWNTLDECKEVIEGLDDTYNSLASHRVSEVMRVLTLVMTIMVPLTVVTGMYGMNIPLPGGVERGSLTSFLVILGIMGAIAGGMIVFFRRKRWI